MPRIIGSFDSQPALEEVIEQLALNGIERTTMLSLSGQAGEVAAHTQDLDTLHLPQEQAAEYRARLQRRQYLLLVEAGALELPTVQRILRNGQVADIDLLPETGA